MDIQVVVQQQLEKIIRDGKLEATVRAKVEKTVEEVVQDMVRSYSDFGKGLKEEITKAFKINFDQISAVDYNHIVVTIVKEQLDKRLLESVKEPIVQEIDGYFGALEKKEWKLSEIVDELKKHEVSHDRGGCGSISLYINKSNYGSTHVYIDHESGKKSYDCQYQFSITTKTGIPYTFRSGKYHPHNGDLRIDTINGSFEKLLFRLYAQKAVITIDECDTDYCYDED